MGNKHEKLEKNSIFLLICIILVISIGGLVEIVPLFRLETTIEEVEGVRPYKIGRASCRERVCRAV